MCVGPYCSRDRTGCLATCPSRGEAISCTWDRILIRVGHRVSKVRTSGAAFGRKILKAGRWGRSSSTPSRFGGRLCFWCPVDIQHTMVHGTPEEVAQYARRLIDAFGRFRGGFIAKWYPSPEAVGHSWDKIRSMSEAFLEYGGKIYSEGATC